MLKQKEIEVEEAKREKRARQEDSRKRKLEEEEQTKKAKEERRRQKLKKIEMTAGPSKETDEERRSPSEEEPPKERRAEFLPHKKIKSIEKTLHHTNEAGHAEQETPQQSNNTAQSNEQQETIPIPKDVDRSGEQLIQPTAPPPDHTERSPQESTPSSHDVEQQPDEEAVERILKEEQPDELYEIEDDREEIQQATEVIDFQKNDDGKTSTDLLAELIVSPPHTAPHEPLMQERLRFKSDGEKLSVLT